MDIQSLMVDVPLTNREMIRNWHGRLKLRNEMMGKEMKFQKKSFSAWRWERCGGCCQAG